MIGFATIGTNFVTDRFIDAAKKNPDFYLRAVHSRDVSRALLYASERGAEKAYTAYEEIALDPEVDAVYIATPTSTHAKIAMLFMKHGKAVLCEKPIASNASEFDAMAECAKRENVLLMEAYMTRFTPCYEALRDAVKIIGRIRSADLTFAKYSSRYDAYKRGERPNTFFAEYSNGAVMDLGIYCIYPLVDMFGMPENIVASAVLTSEGGVDISGSAVLKYTDFTACINYSKVSTSYLPCEIRGEEGTVMFDKVSEPRCVRLITPDGKDECIMKDSCGNIMCYEADEFIRLYKGGCKQSDKNSLELSRTVMSVLDSVRRQSGVVFPSDK